MTDPAITQAISGMGSDLGPKVLERCRDLYDGCQRALAEVVSSQARDLAYGPNERHRLDIYGEAAAVAKPVLLFIHGGGFVAGDKGGDASHWANANVGRMAARAGLIGAVMNYRLAPAHGWPAGAEDVGAAVAWLRENAATHGGDPERIVLIGTSAGAVHIAGYLAAGGKGVRGAVLLSGLYGYTPLDPRDERYYGAPAHYSERAPRAAMEETALPLFLACAQHDPARFQAEFLGLMAARLARHGTMPAAHIASGHNHYTMAMHLGSQDRRLETEILHFVGACCNWGKET